jgi:transposase
MAALQAAVTLPRRQGRIAGQINRLKMLKRPMCGRAHVDPLARRFLLAASSAYGGPPRQHALAGASR